MIDVLMATYNGEAYLDEQLCSLKEQNRPDIRLLVRDDGSADGTVRTLRRYASSSGMPVEARLEEPHTGNPGANFLSLLEMSDSEYVMFCDQDDVWMPDKTDVTLRAMQEAQARSPHTPLLVHTDLTVTNAELVPIAKSFMQYQNLAPQYRSLPRLIAQNNVTGCTTMLNRSLRDMIRRPSVPVLHDWWAALTAASFGEIVYVPRATVYYRQHSSNAVGAARRKGLRGVLKTGEFSRMRSSLRHTYVVAKTFLRAYEDVLGTEEKDFLTAYSALASANAAERWKTLSHYTAFKNGRLRIIAQVLLG